MNIYSSQFNTYLRFSQSPLTLDNVETRTRQRACQNLTDQAEFTWVTPLRSVSTPCRYICLLTITVHDSCRYQSQINIFVICTTTVDIDCFNLSYSSIQSSSAIKASRLLSFVIIYRKLMKWNWVLYCNNPMHSFDRYIYFSYKQEIVSELGHV